MSSICFSKLYLLYVHFLIQCISLKEISSKYKTNFRSCVHTDIYSCCRRLWLLLSVYFKSVCILSVSKSGWPIATPLSETLSACMIEKFWQEFDVLSLGCSIDKFKRCLVELNYHCVQYHGISYDQVMKQ